MKKYRHKGKNHHNGYTPVHTKSSKEKKKKKDFVSKNRSTELNKKGIELEKSSITQKNILLFIGMIMAVGLLFFDVKDDGMLFEGLGIKFAGSLVGTILLILIMIGIFRNKPKVSLE